MIRRSFDTLQCQNFIKSDYHVKIKLFNAALFYCLFQILLYSDKASYEREICLVV